MEALYRNSKKACDRGCRERRKRFALLYLRVYHSSVSFVINLGKILHVFHKSELLIIPKALVYTPSGVTSTVHVFVVIFVVSKYTL